LSKDLPTAVHFEFLLNSPNLKLYAHAPSKFSLKDEKIPYILKCAQENGLVPSLQITVTERSRIFCLYFGNIQMAKQTHTLAQTRSLRVLNNMLKDIFLWLISFEFSLHSKENSYGISWYRQKFSSDVSKQIAKPKFSPIVSKQIAKPPSATLTNFPLTTDKLDLDKYKSELWFGKVMTASNDSPFEFPEIDCDSKVLKAKILKFFVSLKKECEGEQRLNKFLSQCINHDLKPNFCFKNYCSKVIGYLCLNMSIVETMNFESTCVYVDTAVKVLVNKLFKLIEKNDIAIIAEKNPDLGSHKLNLTSSNSKPSLPKSPLCGNSSTKNIEDGVDSTKGGSQKMPKSPLCDNSNAKNIEDGEDSTKGGSQKMPKSPLCGKSSAKNIEGVDSTKAGSHKMNLNLPNLAKNPLSGNSSAKILKMI